MSKEKTIVFINPGQFGYKAGYYYYCKNLLKHTVWHIEFICFDQGHPKLELDGVNVKYINFKTSKVKRQINWLITIFKIFHKMPKTSTTFFMSYFKFCFIFGLFFPNKNKILDIRTGSIHPNKFRNWLKNQNILATSFFFKKITILSEHLISHLKINKTKCHYLPLGAEILSNKEKNYSSIRLLYVGTFTGRRIHETIEGLRLYLDKNNVDEIISYDIFGFGKESDTKLIEDTIQTNNLTDIITFHGRKNHQQLKPFFDKCNVGIAYVPMTKYYEYQPSTKIFEYALSGMISIATKTYENIQLINNENGLLCNDNPESFALSLEELVKQRNKYNPEKIKNSLSEFSWEEIVKNRLVPILD